VCSLNEWMSVVVPAASHDNNELAGIFHCSPSRVKNNLLLSKKIKARYRLIMRSGLVLLLTVDRTR
jgi:hypothetical protein